ncbi:hypothetical protein HRG_008275 [Hirsutella rhossiliensis]|uniref:Uncharacterized protein n=1 Tax=Hirsutella rhossiliensis TaxID=111463 RepID=A0A9P8MXT4_9HYPO|nr:uncharacterized protein HRG_08275 [Hirsutella rhossiliensis]KAH0961122.1 hypothetical protein HRG_08275 [Hirsutella rhossiliensis]
MSDSERKVKRARDTLSSIYSFYVKNRESIENVPSFISNSSREVQIKITASTVPSAEQTEELKAELRELARTQEVINSIPESERRAMIEAATASTIRRKPKK